MSATQFFAQPNVDRAYVMYPRFGLGTIKFEIYVAHITTSCNTIYSEALFQIRVTQLLDETFVSPEDTFPCNPVAGSTGVETDADVSHFPPR